jgi:hypothetical protein
MALRRVSCAGDIIAIPPVWLRLTNALRTISELWIVPQTQCNLSFASRKRRPWIEPLKRVG